MFIELRNQGVAVLFSTHIISDIEKCADDILYIQKGIIIADSSKEEFCKKYCTNGETLEESILRMERSIRA